jgi:hypothetical protein
MKYSINLRLKNPGPTQYLIDVQERDDFMEAFYAAEKAAKDADDDHFIEIVDNELNEKIVSFKEEE